MTKKNYFFSIFHTTNVKMLCCVCCVNVVEEGRWQKILRGVLIDEKATLCIFLSLCTLCTCLSKISFREMNF